MSNYEEPARSTPSRNTDVVIAGGGTGGVVAALASARMGVKTCLIEAKGYVGGLAVEGGTALHSFYNLWKAFPDVEKRLIVKGIPLEIIDRLLEAGGTSGHAEMELGFDYDSVCTAVDTEIYKRVAGEMLEEAGVEICLNTWVVGAITEGSRITGVLTECHGGREAVMANSFVDMTGYGDLAAHAGAEFTEPNDYPVANSIGVGGVSVEGYHAFLESSGALAHLAEGIRDGSENRIVRLQAKSNALPEAFAKACKAIGMASVITTTHDDYFMFVKLNYRMPESPTNRAEAAKAEQELRRRQARAIELIREWIPGCENAFIARSSPSLCIRRGRLIKCDYDISRSDVLDARHFEDDVMTYGFHDNAPRLQIANGGSYGIPYRALLPVGCDNLFVAGMLITSDHDAHMSTRNTVCCMGQGQAAGTAAAMCSKRGLETRELPYVDLRAVLIENGVHLEPMEDL